EGCSLVGAKLRQTSVRFGRRLDRRRAGTGIGADQCVARRSLHRERRCLGPGEGAVTEASETARIEQRVNNGLLGQWYVVAKSVEVAPGRPHGVKALGRNLVLWRDEDGKIHCLDDRCPHRGAPLSRGEVIEGNIVCRYHGVTLDAAGKVLRVPAMPNCALEGRQGAEAYATNEANDGVFVYFPSAEAPEPRPIDLPAEFTNGEFAMFLCTAPWECNYRYALDNLVDPMH